MLSNDNSDGDIGSSQSASPAMTWTLSMVWTHFLQHLTYRPFIHFFFFLERPLIHIQSIKSPIPIAFLQPSSFSHPTVLPPNPAAMSAPGPESSSSTMLKKAFPHVDIDGHDLPPSPAPSSPRAGKRYAIATELVYTESNDQYNASSVPIYQVCLIVQGIFRVAVVL